MWENIRRRDPVQSNDKVGLRPEFAILLALEPKLLPFILIVSESCGYFADRLLVQLLCFKEKEVECQW